MFSCRFYFSSRSSFAILLFHLFLLTGACLLLKIIIFFPRTLSGFWWGHCGAGYTGRGVIQGQHSDHATPSWQSYSLDLWHAGNGLVPDFSYPFVFVLVLKGKYLLWFRTMVLMRLKKQQHRNLVMNSSEGDLLRIRDELLLYMFLIGEGACC